MIFCPKQKRFIPKVFCCLIFSNRLQKWFITHKRCLFHQMLKSPPCSLNLSVLHLPPKSIHPVGRPHESGTISTIISLVEQKSVSTYGLATTSRNCKSCYLSLCVYVSKIVVQTQHDMQKKVNDQLSTDGGLGDCLADVSFFSFPRLSM